MLYDICRQHGAVRTGYDYRCPKCGTQTYKGKSDGRVREQESSDVSRGGEKPAERGEGSRAG